MCDPVWCGMCVVLLSEYRFVVLGHTDKVIHCGFQNGP